MIAVSAPNAERIWLDYVVKRMNPFLKKLVEQRAKFLEGLEANKGDINLASSKISIQIKRTSFSSCCRTRKTLAQQKPSSLYAKMDVPANTTARALSLRMM